MASFALRTSLAEHYLQSCQQLCRLPVLLCLMMKLECVRQDLEHMSCLVSSPGQLPYLRIHRELYVEIWPAADVQG